MSHKKFGPNRFSRFDVYWIQTKRQTDKPNLYIDNSKTIPKRNKIQIRDSKNYSKTEYKFQYIIVKTNSKRNTNLNTY